MPVVPDIAMGIRAPEPSQTVINSLGIVGQAAQVANAIQGIQARQEAGRIAAQGGSLTDQLEALRSNPMVMGFDPEAVNPVISAIGAQGQLSTLYSSALQNVLKNVITGVNGGPDLMRKSVNAALQTYPTLIRDHIAPSVNAFVNSVTDTNGMPADKAGQQQTMNNRVRAIMGAVGVPSDIMDQQFGTAGIHKIGGADFGVLMPPAGTGRAPSIIGQPAGATTSAAGGGVGMDTGTGVTGNIPMSWTGKPLTSDEQATGFMPGAGLGGQRPLYSASATANDTLTKNFAGPETAQYGETQKTLQNLQLAQADLVKLISTGGFMLPGAGGDVRAELAKVLNTAFQIIKPDSKPPLDPMAIGASESLKKINRQLAYGMSQAYGDTGHQAAIKIIQNTMAVPSIEQSPIGSMLIASSWEAMLNRSIDEYRFKNQWMADNQGNLNGAEAAFNKEFPPIDYANKVLSNFGLNDKGQFVSGAAIQKAINAGLYSAAEVKNAIRIGYENKLYDRATANKLLEDGLPDEFGHYKQQQQ